MIGYRIDDLVKNSVDFVFNEDAVYDKIFAITNDERESIECGSWSELAIVGDVYTHDFFLIEAVEF